MKFVRATLLNLLILTACSIAAPLPTYSLELGEVTRTNQFNFHNNKRNIKFKIGTQYGWRISIKGLTGKHEFSYEMILPGPAEWPNASNNQNLSTRGNHVKQSQVIDFSDFEQFPEIYEVIKGDPRGEYKFLFYIDDQIIEKGSIFIK